MIELGLILLVALGVVVVAMPVEARVSDETVVPRPRDVVEPQMLRMVASLPASHVDDATPGQVTVRSSYMPSWAVLVAIFAFPIGLVVLAFARRKLELYVRFLDEPGGETRVLVVGRTRRRIARAIGEAVDSPRESHAGASVRTR